MHSLLVRSARLPGTPDCCAIAVMAKASSPGRTKTRLSPPLTLEEAAELNTVFVADIADNVARAGCQANIACYMAFGPPNSAPFFELHVAADVGLVESWLPNFGDCLFHTVESLLALGYGAACVLNSDSPTLPTSVLVEAAQALHQPGERVVLGPCSDGGYYLLGLTRPRRRLFEDIAWSTGRVLDQTLERVAELGLPIVMLPTWYDVDDAASLRVLMRETLDGVGFSAERPSYRPRQTTEFMRRHRLDGNFPLLGGAPGESTWARF